MNKRDFIRTSLVKHNLSQGWLIIRLKEYHLYVDASELSTMLRGRRTGKKADDVINASIAILEYYEKCFPLLNDGPKTDQ